MTVETGHDTRTREAAEWFARLKQRRVHRADVEAFSAWRREPENAAAFARLEALWDAAGVLAADPEMAELTRAAAEPGAAGRRSRSRRAWKPAAGLAAAVLVLGGVGGVWFLTRPEIHTTGFGERDHVRLADGSSVHLDAETRIAVRMSGAERRIELLEGEALFAVSRDPERPFVVTAGQARITALGTRFDVRRRGSDVRVVLVEGRVRVEADKAQGARAWTLAPQQQITPTAAAPVVSAADVSRATSWTAGRLMFDRTSLAAAIVEVNRYSRTPVELRAPDLADIEVSGVFNTGDADAFVSAVTALYPLHAVPEDGAIVLKSAPKR